MIVIDASAIVELITDEGGRSALVAEVLASDAEWLCPQHTVIEAANALRGLWLGGRCSMVEFDARVAMLVRLNLQHVPTALLLARIHELAANATAYDAAYLAAAEHLDVPLITVDRKLARVPGARAQVRVVA